MSDAPILIEHDWIRLRSLLSTALARHVPDVVHGLEARLAHAQIVARERVPPDVVTMGSRVRYRALGAPKDDEITLVWPWDDAPEWGRVGVLSPLGAALLGARAGSFARWRTSSGRCFDWFVEGAIAQPLLRTPMRWIA